MTSSTRSSSIEMSGRKLGTVAVSRSAPSGALAMPIAVSFSAACASGISNPARRDSPANDSDTRRSSCCCG